MEQLFVILETYGYWLLLAVGLAEYGGVPIASIPVLIAGGAFAAMGRLELPLVAASAAAGGLIADAGWYALARWKGSRLVGVACGLSSNPNACVVGVQHRVTRLGAAYVLSAKFLPGAGNLVAPAAGYARIPLSRFLALDAVALLVWAVVYSGVGWIFSAEVEAAIEVVLEYARWLLWLGVALVAGFALWRAVKIRRHRRMHESAPDPMASCGCAGS